MGQRSLKKGAKRLAARLARGLRAFAGSLGTSVALRPMVMRMFLSHTNIVYYHLIGGQQPYYAHGRGGECSVDRFARDIAELKHTFTFTSLEKLCAYNQCGTVPDMPDKPFMALTFDDGFRLSAPQVLQVLDDHGIKATQFLITSCVGNRNLMWRNKLFAIQALVPGPISVTRYNALAERTGFPPIADKAGLAPASSAWPMSRKDEWADELWRACDMPPVREFLDEHQPYFSWEEAEALLAAGHGIGLHTLTHPYCSRLSDGEIEDEIVHPAADLRARFELSFMPFSYPFGDRMAETKERELLARGVFDCAFGNSGFARRGTAPHRLERVGIEGGGIAWPVFGRPAILYGFTSVAARPTRAGSAASGS
jgi:peptidoglycan/xylan/chitin deacetylase (PgdA/CDA1 family)